MHHRCHLYILRAYRMLPQVSNPLIGQCRTPPSWWLRCAESALLDVLLPFVFPNSTLPFFLSLSPSHCFLSQSHTLHLSITLPPFLLSSSNPRFSQLSTNSFSTDLGRNFTSFVNFSAARPDSPRQRINAGFLPFSPPPPAKKN